MSSLEYRKSYTLIFVFFYLCEGFSQGIPYLFWPQYLADTLGGSYDISLWLMVYAIGNIPWSIKAIVGLFSDRWGSKKYGKRFPWIASFGTFGGMWWIIMTFWLPTSNIYFWFALYYFMTQLGMAFADSALDGLILDVTPKEKLARVQGYTWTIMFLGYGIGGMGLGLLFLLFNIVPLLFLITGILVTIASILPILITEPPLEEITNTEWGRDLLTVVTKKRNYKVFIFTFFAGIQSVMLLQFFMYEILIGMGLIDVSNTILTIISGGSVDLQAWSSIFYLANGVGIVFGSLFSGKFADVSRKKTVTRIYWMYLPFCLVLVLPFAFITGDLFSLIFGITFLILLGALQNAFVVVSQTIRGDLSKKYYPKLRGTFFALLVSLANLGGNLGTLFGAWIFAFFAMFITSFHFIFFIVSAFCALCLGLSFTFFRMIPRNDYELSRNLEINEEFLSKQ